MLAQEEYIAKSGLVCPFCGSSDIIGTGDSDLDRRLYTAGIKCVPCGQHWMDCYRLVGYLALVPE